MSYFNSYSVETVQSKLLQKQALKKQFILILRKKIDKPEFPFKTRMYEMRSSV